MNSKLMQTTRTLKQQPREAAGFTLMEVLIGLAIFAIGFIAVAALLPVGTILQREAFDTMNSHDAARNALAIVRGKEIRSSKLDGLANSPDVQDLGMAQVNDQWPRVERSYPSHIQDLDERRFWWYPLFQRGEPKPTAPSQWRIYIIVMQQVKTDEVPEVDSVSVSSASGSDMTVSNPKSPFRVGDEVLASDGTIYRILETNESGNRITVEGKVLKKPLELWYAVGDEKGVATRKIVVVADGVRE